MGKLLDLMETLFEKISDKIELTLNNELMMSVLSPLIKNFLHEK